jgi:GR25 family glycosyltransferase involved in LPS biosynthesis
MLESIKDYKKIPAFVINLEHRTDRKQRVLQRFADINLTVNLWKGSILTKTEMSFGLGHAGAVDSHRRIWQHIVDNNISQALIFEDDVVLNPDFESVYPKAVAELPPDWAIWHFHSSHAPVSPVSEHIVRLESACWGAHGYLIRKTTCEFLLKSKITLIDTMLTHTIIVDGGAVYGMPNERMLCFQEGLDSDILFSAQLEFWRNQRKQFLRKVV